MLNAAVGMVFIRTGHGRGLDVFEYSFSSMQCFLGQIELLLGCLQGGRDPSFSLESSLDS